MKSLHTAWIAANVPNPYGTCQEVTEAMQAAFPELTRVRGHYFCWAWGERAHWWLIDADGQVVDPTAAQFPSRGLGHYEPWIEGTPEPTGNCANCGGPCFNGDTCCSESCGHAYAAYCLNP
jgi:hypothetical protein